MHKSDYAKYEVRWVIEVPVREPLNHRSDDQPGGNTRSNGKSLDQSRVLIKLAGLRI